MKPSLSVVVPAFNEEGNIASCVEGIYQVLKKVDFSWEIIIVNDGSRDKTGEVARKIAKQISHVLVVENNPNRGYGGALKAGFEKASKDLIAFFPADNQFEFSEIFKLLKEMNDTDSDIVSGVRVHRQDPWNRRLLAWMWNNLFVSPLFGTLATDLDCGFKLLKREILKDAYIPAERGAMIDTQLFASVKARGHSVSEIPLVHKPRTTGKSTGSDFIVIIQSLIDLFIYWWQLKREIFAERGKNVFRWEVFAFLAILAIASFTRLYKIDQYMTFLGDEGRDVMVVRDMIMGKKFTLLGPGTSVGNMYLGPLYYYMMVPALALSGLSPVGPAVMVALLGVATVGLLWWWGRQLFGRIPALFVSILYSISPVIITYSHSSWNPNIMPFFALVCMYGLWKIWRFGYWRWLLISAIAFALVLNSHYLGLLLIPPMALFLYLAPRDKKSRNYLLFAFCFFMLLMSPLILFDIRHDFMNFKNIKLFFSDRQTTVNFKIYKAIPNLWTIWDMIVGHLIAKGSSILILLGLAWVIRSKPARDFWFLVVWMGIGLIGLGLYKQHIYDHYFGFLYPVVFLLLGYVFNYLNKYLLIFVTLSLVAISLFNSPLRFSPNNQWRYTQEVADFIIEKANKKSFNLALLSKGNYDRSYRYALSLKDSRYKTLNEQNTDQLFVICEDPDCKPVGNPLWEIAGFGWVKIENVWTMPWGVKIYKLGHYEK